MRLDERYPVGQPLYQPVRLTEMQLDGLDTSPLERFAWAQQRQQQQQEEQQQQQQQQHLLLETLDSGLLFGANGIMLSSAVGTAAGFATAGLDTDLDLDLKFDLDGP